MKRSIRLPDPAFTLVELLVVIAIVTILATILVPTIAKTNQMAKEKATVGLIRRIESACTVYREDTGLFPPDGAQSLYRCLARDWNDSGDTSSIEVGTGRIYIQLDAREKGRFKKDNGDLCSTYTIIDMWGSEIGYDETEITGFSAQTPFSFRKSTAQCNDQYNDPRESGTVASATTSSITDSSKGWGTDALKGRYVASVSNLNNRAISTNSATSLTVARAFTSAPANGSVYWVYRLNSVEVFSAGRDGRTAQGAGDQITGFNADNIKNW